jgi:N-acetylneuraminate synthase
MRRSCVIAAQARVRSLFADAGIALGPASDIEIADFGLGHFEREGLGLVVRVNEPEYCSKWLGVFGGQECPLHYHKIKKETFFVMSGIVDLWVDGTLHVLAPGQKHTISPGVWHRFSSKEGAVIEEVSTHDDNADSYFENRRIVRDPAVEEDVESAGPAQA